MSWKIPCQRGLSESRNSRLLVERIERMDFTTAEKVWRVAGIDRLIISAVAARLGKAGYSHRLDIAALTLFNAWLEMNRVLRTRTVDRPIAFLIQAAYWAALKEYRVRSRYARREVSINALLSDDES